MGDRRRKLRTGYRNFHAELFHGNLQDDNRPYASTLSSLQTRGSGNYPSDLAPAAKRELEIRAGPVKVET